MEVSFCEPRLTCLPTCSLTLVPEVEEEIREVFDRCIAKMRSAPDWQCGLCEKDPLHPRDWR